MHNNKLKETQVEVQENVDNIKNETNEVKQISIDDIKNIFNSSISEFKQEFNKEILSQIKNLFHENLSNSNLKSAQTPENLIVPTEKKLDF